jgi:hypothetical protein
MEIPADTLKEILALRKENGLDATESAAKAALDTVKWVLTETPRYRKAGRSPIYLPGKYLTAKSVDPVTGEVDSQAAVKAGQKSSSGGQGGTVVGNGRAAGKDQKVDETQFYRVLHGKGFAVKITQDILTGELESQVPPSIEKLGLQFGSIPANAEGIYVTQTSPQIQVSMPLDKFLEIAGIKP